MDLELLAARDDGFEEGLAQGLAQSVRSVIRILKSEGIDDSEIIKELMNEFKLTNEEVLECIHGKDEYVSTEEAMRISNEIMSKNKELYNALAKDHL